MACIGEIAWNGGPFTADKRWESRGEQIRSAVVTHAKASAARLEGRAIPIRKDVASPSAHLRKVRRARHARRTIQSARPAAAVIPALVACIKIAAVKTLVVALQRPAGRSTL